MPRSLEHRVGELERWARSRLPPAEPDETELLSWLSIDERLELERALDEAIASFTEPAAAEVAWRHALLTAAQRRRVGWPRDWWQGRDRARRRLGDHRAARAPRGPAPGHPGRS